MATWRIDDLSRPDNQGDNVLWLDHSMATWTTTPTQWHMNAFTAVTMLNTRSLSVSFKQWCNNNGLSDIWTKFLEADGKTITPQYVTADDCHETDHKAEYHLHKWHNEDDNVVANSHIAMRVNKWGSMVVMTGSYLAVPQPRDNLALSGHSAHRRRHHDSD
eukprot:1740306-Amphidinium_carterae.2